MQSSQHFFTSVFKHVMQKFGKLCAMCHSVLTTLGHVASTLPVPMSLQFFCEKQKLIFLPYLLTFLF